MATKKRKKTKKGNSKKKRLKKASQKTVKKKLKAKKPKKARKGKQTPKSAKPRPKIIGVVTHYFPHVNAAVVKLKKPLAVGDSIWIQGSTTNFGQRVESMEIDHVTIQSAKKGDEIGLQVKDRVREHDLVVVPS